MNRGIDDVQSIVNDDCDLEAIRRALRAADARSPYEVVRGSSNMARDLDITDRILLKWRSARIEFTSFIEEPMPGADARTVGLRAAQALRAALDDETPQEEVDDLMRDLQDAACLLALTRTDGTTPGGMAYAQTRSAFNAGFAVMNAAPIKETMRTGDDATIADMLERRHATTFVMSARMDGDVAVVTMQAAGAIGTPRDVGAVDMLRLHARFPDTGCGS